MEPVPLSPPHTNLLCATLAGPCATLTATPGVCPQELRAMAAAMVAGQPVPSVVQPPNLSNRQISLLTPVVLDTVPFFSWFGQVVKNVQGSYQPGSTVSATFR
jgi:hypothetical protein